MLNQNPDYKRQTASGKSAEGLQSELESPGHSFLAEACIIEGFVSQEQRNNGLTSYFEKTVNGIRLQVEIEALGWRFVNLRLTEIEWWKSSFINATKLHDVENIHNKFRFTLDIFRLHMFLEEQVWDCSLMAWARERLKWAWIWPFS